MELKMKKATRVVIAGACAGALALGAALPAFAADTNVGKTNTTVSYNTSTGTSTDNVSWQVFIPTSITFTADKTKDIPFQLELASKAGSPLSTITDLPGNATHQPGEGSVDIRVWSANKMELKVDGTTDPVPYSLTTTGAGGGTTVNNKTTGIDKEATGGIKVATLDAKTKHIVSGTASVDGTPQKGGNHTDTLTFAFWDGTGAEPVGWTKTA